MLAGPLDRHPATDADVASLDALIKYTADDEMRDFKA